VYLAHTVALREAPSPKLALRGQLATHGSANGPLHRHEPLGPLPARRRVGTPKGYFLPNAGSTSAAYWINRNIVYAVDDTRGIDILRYNGPGTDGPMTDANRRGTGRG
jgi:hypothetical protein